jgi:uncharacterized glyoxalase superfamily protein PhnB
MSTRDLWSAPTIVPTLAYEDVPKAVEWLVGAFGFRERPGTRLSWSGGCMTWLELGEGLIHVATSGGHGLCSPRTVSGLSQAVKVYVADLDRHFQQAKAAGARIVSEPEDGFWGGRIYRVMDLEGHHWEFSQRGRDLAAHHWQLPPGITRQ